VDYKQALCDPRDYATRICGFLGQTLDIDAMARAVDPRLYRNRR
jgi:hypothetical protein